MNNKYILIILAGLILVPGISAKKNPPTIPSGGSGGSGSGSGSTSDAKYNNLSIAQLKDIYKKLLAELNYVAVNSPKDKQINADLNAVQNAIKKKSASETPKTTVANAAACNSSPLIKLVNQDSAEVEALMFMYSVNNKQAGVGISYGSPRLITIPMNGTITNIQAGAASLNKTFTPTPCSSGSGYKMFVVTYDPMGNHGGGSIVSN